MATTGTILLGEAPPSKINATGTSLSMGRIYRWKCIVDPSPHDDFLGNFFRQADLDAGGFQNGTVFENVANGKVISVYRRQQNG